MIAAVRNRLTYSNVLATMALFIALGGVAVAAGLPKNSVGARQLKRGAVTPAKLRKQAVTSAKLAPKSVISGKLGENSVGPGNIGNGAVTTAKLAANSVIASTIKNSVITTNKLNNEAVTTAKLGNESVTSAKLGNESVTSAKLGKGSVTAAKLSDEIGPLLGPLGNGQTLRGYFALGQAPNEESATLTDSYTFQFPLPTAPLGAPVTIIDTTTASPAFTSGCPGIAGGGQTPQAAPGFLCVYITGKTNLDATPLAFVNGPTRLGFGLQAKAGTAKTGFEAVGQWAVTAPLAVP